MNLKNTIFTGSTNTRQLYWSPYAHIYHKTANCKPKIFLKLIIYHCCSKRLHIIWTKRHHRFIYFEPHWSLIGGHFEFQEWYNLIVKVQWKLENPALYYLTPASASSSRFVRIKWTQSRDRFPEVKVSSVGRTLSLKFDRLHFLPPLFFNHSVLHTPFVSQAERSGQAL